MCYFLRLIVYGIGKSAVLFLRKCTLLSNKSIRFLSWFCFRGIGSDVFLRQLQLFFLRQSKICFIILHQILFHTLSVIGGFLNFCLWMDSKICWNSPQNENCGLVDVVIVIITVSHGLFLHSYMFVCTVRYFDPYISYWFHECDFYIIV